jgi:DNA adenine methylase
MNDLIDLCHHHGLHDVAYDMYVGCGKPECTDCKLRPIIARQGNKFQMCDIIIPMIPPHKVYVEPFAGSAAIFFQLPKAEVSVLNDLDKHTYNFLRRIQHAPLDVSSYPDPPRTVDAMKKQFTKKQKTTQDKIVHELIRSCCGFNSLIVNEPKQIYNTIQIRGKIDKICSLKEKLKGVKILNEDYADVIRKYDSKDSFFFLDPPYEKSDKRLGYAESTDFDFERLENILCGIQGKFLMTINDSPRIRKLFKSFHQKKFNAKTQLTQINSKTSSKPYLRKELFISNYTLP